MRRAIVFLLVAIFALAANAEAGKRKHRNDNEIVFAQLSDLHIGLSSHPEATSNAQRAVALVNSLNVDFVVVSGDIAENSSTARATAKSILSGLNKPYFVVPGNHDVQKDSMTSFRSTWGADYYTFNFQNLRVIALNSQLMGNFDNYSATAPTPLSAAGEVESQKMFAWLAS